MQPDWKDQLLKQAAAGPQEAPRDQIAEAFAAQAYTAVENRCGLLMNDPHILGFEIIERNEQNNRLVGAFAFRVGDTLLLAPVFFLNGTVKGQYLLYNKTEDRFFPNNKTQIKSLMAKESNDVMGGAVDRNHTRGATMSFDVQALASPQMKTASAEDAVIIRELWKDACAAADRQPDTQPLFKQFLVDHPEYKEKAAALAEKDNDFAEAIVISRALEADTILKQASAPAYRGPVLVTDIPADTERFSSLSAELFKRGFAIDDDRPDDKLLDAFISGDKNTTLRSTGNTGIDYVLDSDGNAVKVLCGPVLSRDFDDCMHSRSMFARERNPNLVVVIEGKGPKAYAKPGYREKFVFSDESVSTAEDLAAVGSDLPTVGKDYLIFLTSSGKFANSYPFRASKVKKDGDMTVVTIARDYGSDSLPQFIVRKDLDTTLDEDARCAYGYGEITTPVLGADARFIECEPKESAKFMKIDSLLQIIEGRASRAKMTITKKANTVYLQANGKTRTYETDSSAAMKLARLGLKTASIYQLLDKAEAERVEFDIIPSLEKVAHAWYDREPDYQNDFLPTGYDPDFNIPFDNMDGMPAMYPTRRERATRNESHWLDAPEPIGSQYSGQAHLPDSVLFGLTDPANQLSQISQSAGLDHLIDHGALGTLVKTFDAVALASSYLEDLEKGVDRLGRIIFLVLWKPHDFAEKFGENDLPHLENTLVSAFEKHGDMVLELRQHSGSNE